MTRVLLCAAAVALAGCQGEDTVTPAPLSVTCAATPASGPAPLAVAFTLNVSGAQGAISVRINYGDGATGSDVAVPHTYQAPGTYTASFTASTASQSALCSTAVQVSAPPPASPSPSPTPTPGVNYPPLAVFNTTPPPAPGGLFTGRPPLRIQFNMCPTSDPDGDDLLFTIDFQGDGTDEVRGPTGADCRRTWDYPLGTYYPRLCVTDLTASLQPAHPFQCRGYTVQVKR